MIQRLISRGHLFSEVKNYTLKQVECFLQACNNEDEESFELMAKAHRASMASDKDFKKLMES